MGRRARRVGPQLSVPGPGSGPFIWGPLADRALLGGLAIEQVGSGSIRAAGEVQPGPASWGHPVGTAVVFVAPDGGSLQKVYMDRQKVQDISPFRNARYLNVVYHPSGLTIAFVLERGGTQSIWLSSNLGRDPQRLVFTHEGTRFGALAFHDDGRHLFYAAQHADDHPELHRLDLGSLHIPVIWSGQPGQHIQDIRPGPELTATAFDLGTSCGDSTAMVLPGSGVDAVAA